MSRLPDPKKLAEWRGRLERFSLSGLTVAGFCRQEGVSSPSFYNWRKRLKKFSLPGGGAFQRVAVLHAKSEVSIHLPCGARIDVQLAHLDALRAVVAELVRCDGISDAKLSERFSDSGARC